MTLTGHLWTSLPSVAHRLRPRTAPPAVRWETTLEDSEVGPITLQGCLRDQPSSDTCLVLVHGLGGTTEAFYVVDAAHAAERAGLSCLRLALRGADRRGEDFYHAGLTADLEAALRSPALARYSTIYVLGYSLGGHMTLRFGLNPTDPRVKAIAAISPPLDLDRTAAAIDTPAARIYRYHVLQGLNEIYAAVAARRDLTHSADHVRAAASMREWDTRAVVPRHGFGTVDNYYKSMSVGPRLPDVQLPALIVHSDQDPMIPTRTFSDLLAVPTPNVESRVIPRGGHVAFPAGRDGRTVDDDVIAWLSSY